MQLQHSTNLNIQRSQSTHRFNGQSSLDNNRDQDEIEAESTVENNQLIRQYGPSASLDSNLRNNRDEEASIHEDEMRDFTVDPIFRHSGK